MHNIHTRNDNTNQEGKQGQRIGAGHVEGWSDPAAGARDINALKVRSRTSWKNKTQLHRYNRSPCRNSCNHTGEKIGERKTGKPHFFRMGMAFYYIWFWDPAHVRGSGTGRHSRTRSGTADTPDRKPAESERQASKAGGKA